MKGTAGSLELHDWQGCSLLQVPPLACSRL